jgi:hypothetical protein
MPDPKAKKKPEDMTTDEKAAELGEGWGPFMKKYGVIIVPLIVGTITTVFILNNNYYKDKLEEVFPAYVQFVRKFHSLYTISLLLGEMEH